jgi:flagellar secretion chaperone FliS
MKSNNPKIAYSDLKIRSATSLELVIMLYDMLAADLRSALGAIYNLDVELRTNELNHALQVLQQLQGSLKMEEGGNAAKQLDQFYDFLRAKFLEAQLRSSSTHLGDLLEAVTTVRDGWAQLLGKQNATDSTVPIATPTPRAEDVRASWTA